MDLLQEVELKRCVIYVNGAERVKTVAEYLRSHDIPAHELTEKTSLVTF